MLLKSSYDIETSKKITAYCWVYHVLKKMVHQECSQCTNASDQLVSIKPVDSVATLTLQPMASFTSIETKKWFEVSNVQCCVKKHNPPIICKPKQMRFQKMNNHKTRKTIASPLKMTWFCLIWGSETTKSCLVQPSDREAAVVHPVQHGYPYSSPQCRLWYNGCTMMMDNHGYHPNIV